MCEEMRELEAASARRGIGYDEMMGQAGRAVADVVAGLLPPGGRCVLLCGSGNNGGDGYVAARSLKERGFPTTVVSPLAPPKTLSAQRAYVRAEEAGVEILGLEGSGLCAGADVVVDALFGTGFHGRLPGVLADLARGLVGHRCVVSVDLPSGLISNSPSDDCESVHARYTLCLEAAKPACLMLPAAARCGEVRVLPIGVADGAWGALGPAGRALSEAEAVSLLPERPPTANKGSFGKLLTLCGCASFTGAAALSAGAALAAGAGLVTVAATDRVAATVGAALWEATFLPLTANAEGGASAENLGRLLERARGMTALLAGCGMGRSEDTDRLVDGLLDDCSCRLILDADALHAIKGRPGRLRNAALPPILTPHVGEMSRLTGRSIAEIKASAPALARAFAREHNAVLVLKDASTVVAAPDGRLFYHTGGNSGLARGGSGDLLAGLIASLAAQGMEAAEAAAVGVALHGAAGARCAARRSARGMQPHELIDDLCDIFLERERR